MKALLCREFGPLEGPRAGGGFVPDCGKRPSGGFRQGRGRQLSRHAHRAREVSDPLIADKFGCEQLVRLADPLHANNAPCLAQVLRG